MDPYLIVWFDIELDLLARERAYSVFALLACIAYPHHIHNHIPIHSSARLSILQNPSTFSALFFVSPCPQFSLFCPSKVCM